MNSTLGKMKDLVYTTINVQNKSSDSVQNRGPLDMAKDVTLKSTNEDVQRAIEGLKEIPDEELQEFLDDEDFMEGLDVVDAWEGDEERNHEAEQKTIQNKDRMQKHASRDKHRRDRKGTNNREKPKREETRRDPSKSTKDIERDKIRTKRDTENKLLAEKEKAIKNLLDSDDVVPPGTETEAIQSITEKQNLERAQMRIHRSRERRRSAERQRGSPLRRRSLDRNRLSAPRRRSPLLLSPERRRSPFKTNSEKHRSPFRNSLDKRRSPIRFNSDRRNVLPSPERRRRSPFGQPSWERRTSADRRWSIERHRRRIDLHERRRSRSRDRQRSRSMERLRRRASRSPIGRRYSPRRRSRTRSRSSERRTRKRSPFINELARQLRNEAMITPCVNPGYIPPPSIDGIAPLPNTVVYQQEVEPGLQMTTSPYMHQTGLQPSLQSGLPSTSGGPPFMNFDILPQSISFDPIPVHALPQTEYSAPPVMYNQSVSNSVQSTHRPTLLPAPVASPQPVPAPTSMDHIPAAYNVSHVVPSRHRSPSKNFEHLKKSTNTSTAPSQTYRDRRSPSPYSGCQPSQEKRLKTPEPPVISDTKQFEKTSLSSLLEASVSVKDSADLPVLYPGFKPEILRHCEHALRELPIEDPRLKMKGRFFYDPTKEDQHNKLRERSSNSVLLQQNKSKIYWEDEEEQHLAIVKQNVQMHQKICQTDNLETDTKFVQATVTMVDFEVQVYPHDLQPTPKEEKRPIMDRLDWNVRETFDYAPKLREADDLRWSLSNSSQKRSWSRTLSSPRRSDEHEHRLDSMSSLDHSSRSLKMGSPTRNRDSFSSHKGSIREHYVRERYSPNYRHPLDERDDMHDNRSNHSHGESPMVLEDSGEELEVDRVFQREADFHGRGKLLRGRSSPLIKPHFIRGKHSGGRPYRGRGSFRGKF